MSGFELDEATAAQNLEEQADELEALGAIYDEDFASVDATTMDIVCGPDPGGENNPDNHVVVNLRVQYPPSYPSAPLGPADLVVKPLKGLAPPHIAALQEVALAAASDEDYAGTAAIFGVCTAVQEWLAEHNETGLDDMSAHAVMMRRETENAAGDEDAEEATDGAKPKGAAAAIAAKGDGADRVLTPFVDGDTPVTEATFAAWKEGFDAEMAAAAAADPSAAVFGCKYAGNGKTPGKRIFLEMKGVLPPEPEPEPDGEVGVLNEALYDGGDDDDDLSDLDSDSDDGGGEDAAASAAGEDDPLARAKRAAAAAAASSPGEEKAEVARKGERGRGKR